MAAKRRVDLSHAESPEPDAVESVAGAGQGGGSAEVDDTSASPATPETVEEFVFITPSGEKLCSRNEALVWIENEFDSIVSRMSGAELGKVMAVLRNRRLRSRLLRDETRNVDVSREPGITQAEAIDLLRGCCL